MKPALKISFHTNDNSTNKYEFTHLNKHILQYFDSVDYIVNRYGMMFDISGNMIKNITTIDKPFIHIVLIANNIEDTYERVLSIQQIETLQRITQQHTDFEIFFNVKSKIKNLSLLKSKYLIQK